MNWLLEQNLGKSLNISRAIFLLGRCVGYYSFFLQSYLGQLLSLAVGNEFFHISHYTFRNSSLVWCAFCFLQNVVCYARYVVFVRVISLRLNIS